jgi:16S rRNA (adenine1518-N6/adenine1519-N6)-dimethyltransferase
VEESGFLRFVRLCFAQKRKTLANNLRATAFPPAAIAAALAQAGLSPLARAEALSIESFAGLWRCLEIKGGTPTGE